jgi:hypothetical protein
MGSHAVLPEGRAAWCLDGHGLSDVTTHKLLKGNNMKIGAMKTILVLGFSLVWIAGASAQKGPESPVQSEQGAQKAPMPMGASTIQGELLKIEGATDGAFYTVKDPSGKE